MSRGERSSACVTDESARVLGACWFSTSLIKSLSTWVFDLAERFCLLARDLLVIFWKLCLIQEWWTLGLESREGYEVWHMTMSFGFLVGGGIGYLAIWWFFTSLEASELLELFIYSCLKFLGFLVGEGIGYLAAWWFFTGLSTSELLERFLWLVQKSLLVFWGGVFIVSAPLLIWNALMTEHLMKFLIYIIKSISFNWLI